jgi:thiol:disulfide interchange protein DsbA
MRFGFALLIAVGTPAWSADPVEGRDYIVLKPAQPTDDPNKIAVTEFFSYQCGHCYAFSAPLRAWMAKQPKDVMCRRESVAVGYRAWEPSARAFYALESIGRLEPLDAAIFDAIHVQRESFATEEGITRWLAAKGVPADQFRIAYRGFDVNAGFNRGNQLAIAHRIRSVPTMIVDGKYLVAIASNIDYAKQLAVVDALIKKVRAEKRARKR